MTESDDDCHQNCRCDRQLEQSALKVFVHCADLNREMYCFEVVDNWPRAHYAVEP